MSDRLPISGIIPTSERNRVLLQTILSISKQSFQPAEIIVIDASEEFNSTLELDNKFSELKSELKWVKADKKGAAKQRNQGVSLAKYDFILFMDDDIVLEENCIERLWIAINTYPKIGGANAMITNQRYLPPGLISCNFFKMLNGKKLNSYAGKVIGPAYNLLPEDNPSLPEIIEVEWINTTCSLYRKKALPSPLFPTHFEGYSLMEDLALSLSVGKKWRLYNARTARIFHNSQSGKHKNNIIEISKMELVNRHYIMTRILGRKGFINESKLFLLQIFGFVSFIVSHRKVKGIAKYATGKLMGYWEINKLKSL